MVNSMLSNVKLTLKSTIPTSYGTGDTFTVFETWIVAEAASVVFSNKTQLERFQVDIANTGVCTIVLRWLDNTEIKTEVAWLKKAWDVGANWYITILASDIFDKDATSPQRLKAPFIFEEDIIIEKDLKVEWNIKVEWDFEVDWPTKPFPEVDDEIARDILYPNPTGWEIAIVWWYIQIYNADTAQWETLDVGTPLPDATETVKGKIRIATEEEALAWSNDTVAMTPKKVKELTTTEIEANEASLTDNTFMLWEPCSKWDSLFKEVWPIFAQAVTAQNIGDVAGNTRVSIPVIWTWVAGNGLELALAKVDDLWEDLTLRIETDNAGEPSGDLVEDSATATVLRTSLTTSLTDTDIALNAATIDNEHWVTLDNLELTQSGYRWLKFTFTSKCWLLSVDKVAACTATKAYLYNEVGDLLDTETFVTNTATFNNSKLINWESYYILVWSDWADYTSVKQTGVSAFPYIEGRLDFICWYVWDIKVTDAHPVTSGDITSTTTPQWCKITTNNDLLLYTVKKFTSCNATRAILKSSEWQVLATASFSSHTANFVWYKLSNWTEYRIELDNNWSSYDSIYWNSNSTLPYNKTNINYTNWSVNWVNDTRIYSILDIWTSVLSEDTNLHNITQIKTNDNILIWEWQKAHIVLAQEWDEVDPARYFKVGYSTNNTTTRPMNVFDWADWGTADNDKFAYTSSDLFTNSLLSKTDATYYYKLPTDIPRFAKANWVIWEYPKCSYLGIADLFTGLTEWSDYFLQNTPWAIGATAGTNRYKVWDSVDTTKLNIWTDDINTWTTYLWYNSTTERTTTSTSYVKLKESLITKAWTYKISYDARWIWWTYWLFINWVLYDEYVYSIDSRITHTLNISLKELDVVSLWAKTSSSTNPRVANFKSEYTITKFIGAILLD